MSNTNIQAKIPIKGRGFTFKAEGNFQPGEYKTFNNVEFSNEGVIVNRNNILATGKTTNPSFAIDNPFGFIGAVRDYVLVASHTDQWAVSYDANYQCWSPGNLPVDAGGGYHKVVGVFIYNNMYYWITFEYLTATDTYKINLYNDPNSSTADAPNTIQWANLVKTECLTVAAPAQVPIITNFFVHKDRLWISTQDTMYFSKATDVTIWPAPDGGFFKIPDQTIKYTFSLSDTIYVLCENSIYVLTYSLDVNEDGYLRMISDNMGAEWGCVHQASPVVVNKYGIYSVSSGNLVKVVDTKFDTRENVYQHKIVSFERNLILIRRSMVNYNPAGAEFDDTGKYYDRTASDNGYNVFVINTDTSSISILDFTDARDAANPGYLVDALVNPYRDFFGAYRMYFLTNRFVAADSYKGSTYVMSPEKDEVIYDEARMSNNAVERYKPRISIEIDSFTPDGSEYLMKKFRNLVMMGKFPDADCQIAVAYDNNSYHKAVPLLDTAVGGRPHFPHRLGLFQRGRSLSLKINMTNDNVLPVGTTYDQFEFSEAYLFWSYTQRMTPEKNPSLK